MAGRAASAHFGKLSIKQPYIPRKRYGYTGARVLRELQITTAQPDIPPDCVQADIMKPNGVTSQIFTYGSRILDDDKFGAYDSDLRHTIAWCMAHRPGDRPEMAELAAIFDNAIRRTAREFDEPLEEFRTSVPQLLNSPPPQRPSVGIGLVHAIRNPGGPANDFDGRGASFQSPP